jgi:hypothetical protein
MKRVTAYLRNDTIYMHPCSQTTDGVWILTLPCLKLDAQCADLVLGEHILRTLDESRTGIAHPKEWRGVIAPLLELAGVRAWSTFMRRASCVEVREDEVKLSVIRTKNLGPQEGFLAASEQSWIVLPGRDAKEIAAAVRSAFLPWV